MNWKEEWKLHNGEGEVPKWFSELIMSMEESYAHSTENGYCCACPYDIACLEEEVKRSQQQLLERLSESHILKYERHKIFECNRGPLEKALYEDWCENPECHSVDAVITRERNRLKKEVKALIQEEKSKI